MMKGGVITKLLWISGLIASIVFLGVVVGIGLFSRSKKLSLKREHSPISSPQPTLTLGQVSPTSSLSPTPAPRSPEGKIKKAIADFLSQESLFNLTSGKGEVFCAHYLYGWDEKPDAVRAYAWIYCQEYTHTPEGKIEEGAGISEPVLFVLERKGDQLKVQDVYQPKEGDKYVASIKQMFPPKYAQEAINNQPDIQPLVKEVQRKMKAYFAD